MAALPCSFLFHTGYCERDGSCDSLSVMSICDKCLIVRADAVTSLALKSFWVGPFELGC